MPSASQQLLQSSGGNATGGTSSTSSGGSSVQLLNSLKNNTYKPQEYIAPKEQPATKQTFTQEPKKTGQNIKTGAGKFLARTAVGFADLVTEQLDFAVSFLANNNIFNQQLSLQNKLAEKVTGKKSQIEETRVKQTNKWNEIIKNIASQPKQLVDKIEKTPYLQPSKEWSNSSIEDKIKKYPGETLAILGPSMVPSFALYALNPTLGLTTTIGATANQVKSGAIENGVPEGKAELLGAATGILVGALDRLVPDELFSPSQKSKFISGFAKRIIPISLKEAGTEVAQENLQIAAEATFRKDLGWDEIKTRNVLSGLGGLLGGAGATTIVGTINQTFNQDILGESDEAIEVEDKPDVMTPQEAVAVAVSEDMENTPQGQEIARVALQAEAEGQNVQVEVDDKGKVTAQVLAPEVQDTATAKVEVAKPEEPTQSKAVERAVIKPKEVSVPRQQLPVGEGKKKLSRLEARVTESLTKAPDEVKDLSTYNQMVKKDQVGKAVTYVNENPDEAIQVLRGEKEAPKGLLNNSIFVALYNQAKGDTLLARKLATLASTRAGQEISILTELDPDSPVKYMRDVVKIREEAFTKRFRNKTVKQATDQVVKDIKKSVQVPDKTAWASFLKSIEC